MEMEGMEGAILIFMLGNMEQTVARKQTKREKNNTQKRTEGWKQKGIWLFWYAVVPVFAFYLMECYEHNPFAEVRVEAQLFNIFLFVSLPQVKPLWEQFQALIGRKKPRKTMRDNSEKQRK